MYFAKMMSYKAFKWQVCKTITGKIRRDELQRRHTYKPHLLSALDIKASIIQTESFKIDSFLVNENKLLMKTFSGLRLSIKNFQ